MSDKIVSFGEIDREATVSDNISISAEARAELISIGADDAVIRIGSRQVVVPYLLRGEEIEFLVDGEHYLATVSDKNARRKARHREHSMSAPMPGVVLKIMVDKGAQVRKGDPLMVLEAMKMEHQIAAPYDGTVTKIACSVGELVQPGVDLIEVEPKESE